ncbi:PTS system cellobiose-specific IIA component [Clostridium saccharoperbutylacetonicum]|uniref:Phosphotransferase system PTS, lactose/cellobiose-specific IIA subunit n=1 Tax=Clostridium saccharoperbutylacetonicum N1-4(HMT) TaxID=931276 RepID=M1MIT6_9CLOT|nr:MULTISPECIES: PTS lactose/cellobiose transporter subunit IIA [Clostridium]AGF54741.1 phosphotransferase system PTS, lactose/cellobiose-specific IIA subunit [Clostridium saccharoperbutylacetonicum N1-4(HMT)]NRT58738.1 PTS system cellobiose-specific IIA component [Clostridium saccharoperbutylacetonicum]NSB27927.1 PTS system cellobiose-specific IIA component [Clostridium saccharoperbutylacetonicum]NSB41410.1 PTS system cellobiose-specific IIA component [Clostridium saccharoperbutylacetonicum]
MEELEMAIMNIIVNAGDCKNHAYMALNYVNEGTYEEAEKEMQLANDALALAHDGQTMFLHKEANGEKINISVLFVHAQDHLMTAITEKNLIEQIIELRRVINKLNLKEN